MAVIGKTVVISEWILVCFTLILVITRLRLSYRRWSKLKLPDYFVVAAWIFYIAQASMDTVLSKIGYLDRWNYNYAYDEFKPERNISYEDTVMALKLQYTENNTYYCLMYCIKCAMIAFYYELIPSCLPRFRVALHVIAVYTVVGWTYTLLVNLFGVAPQGQWTIGSGHRRPSFALLGLVGVFHITTDLAIYILPLPLIKKLHLSRPQMIGVVFMFCLGFCCIGFALFLCVAYLFHASKAITSFAGVLEQMWAIFVVCCPAFKSLVTGDIYRRICGIVQRRRKQSGDNSSDDTETGKSGSKDGTIATIGTVKSVKTEKSSGENGELETAVAPDNIRGDDSV